VAEQVSAWEDILFKAVLCKIDALCDG